MKRIGKRNLTIAFVFVAALALAQASAAAESVVNINTATAEQLMLLPRIGPSVAQRILEFREQNGRFKEATDLLLVKGIGDKTFEMIAPYVAISGDTSLKDKVTAEREGGDSNRY